MIAGIHYAATLSAWFDADITEGGSMNEQDKQQPTIQQVNYWMDRATRAEEELMRRESEQPAAAPSPAAQPTVTVQYDLSPAMVEGELRQKLVDLGWTPPDLAASPVAQDEREAFEQWAIDEEIAYHNGHGFWMLPAFSEYQMELAWQARAASPAQDKQDTAGNVGGLTDEKIIEHAQKYCMFDEATRQYDPLRYEILEDFINMVKSLPAGSQDKLDAVDAARWQLARQYLSIDDIERFTSMRAAGHIADEEQSKRADSAIDAAIAAMQAQGERNG